MREHSVYQPMSDVTEVHVHTSDVVGQTTTTVPSECMGRSCRPSSHTLAHSGWTAHAPSTSLFANFQGRFPKFESFASTQLLTTQAYLCIGGRMQ